MKLQAGTPLRVSFAFAPDQRIVAGRLGLERGIALFEYDPSFPASGLAIDPLWPSSLGGLLQAKEPRTFGGLHGAFADSLPDAWGEMLVHRRAARSGIDYGSLTVLDKLAVVGHRGMGALTYEPAFAEDERDATIELDVLAREADAVIEGSSADVLPLLERLGGSSGGARPKVLVAMDERGAVRAGDDRVPLGFDAWIVKFRHRRDRADIGPLEAAYAAMAAAAGVDISESRLVASSRGPGYFATKRFDRGPNGTRRHVLSVAGALDLDWQIPSVDYDGILRLVRAITRRQADVEAMFVRMVFNVVAHNQDDHAKQHAFVMDERGRWMLAPAYDLTFSDGINGEHYLAVDGVGRDIARRSIDAVAHRQGVDAAIVARIVERVVDAVSCFASYAREYGVDPKSIAAITKTLEPHLRACSAAGIRGRTSASRRRGTQ